MDSLLATLTLRQKAAQLIMPWVSGAWTAADDPALATTAQLVDSLGVGGIVVSVGTPGDVVIKLNTLQRMARLPLLVAADFEAGTAFRLAGGTGFPTNMGVGAGGREADAYQMGRVIAEEGRALGVHLGFTPVADVNSNPDNPIINTRSFGGDPALVARLVAAQVRGMQEHGMVAVVKHFPGHGDTDTDSHIGLPAIDADWRRLTSQELVPFRAAVTAGAGGIMSAHIALPRLDQGRIRPATMVPEILTGVLRDSLGFDGLIVTDALDMGAVVRDYGPAEAAVQALLAGADVLLMPTDPRAAVEAVARAVEEGRVTMDRLDRSVRRMLEHKERFGLFEHRTVDPDRAGAVVGRREFSEAAREASARSLVLLRDRDQVRDRLQRGPTDLTIVRYGESGTQSVGAALATALRQRGHRVQLLSLSPGSGAAVYDSIAAGLPRGGVTLVAVSIRAVEHKGSVVMPEPLARLIGRADAAGPMLLISLGSPYLIRQVPLVPGYLLGWTATPMVEQAVAAALHGAPISGRLPVVIPPDWPIGAGLTTPGQP